MNSTELLKAGATVASAFVPFGTIAERLANGDIGGAIEEGLWEAGAMLLGTVTFGSGYVAVKGFKAWRAVKKAQKMLNKRKCFVAGTLVYTRTGRKKIEDVEVGDEVLSKDEETGELVYQKVTQLFITENNTVGYLSFEAESGEYEEFGVTAEHPYWVVGEGWVAAGKLQLGDRVVNAAGGYLSVSAGWVQSQSPATTYNFEVEGTHSYFVGDGGVWVHNACVTKKGLSDNALVVRGGNAANHTPDKINSAIGPSRTSGVEGFSAQCNGGSCLSELGAPLRNKQLGVTTVGDIRRAGGDVVPTPGFGNHVTVTNLSGDAASPLLKIVKNPNPSN